MNLRLSGVLACILPLALCQSQSEGGGASYYAQSQQTSGFYPSPVRSAPYPAAVPNTLEPQPQSVPITAPTGPSGGGFPPPPPFPPTGGAFLSVAPVCTKVAIAITRLHTLLEPIKALMVGAAVFFVVKNFIIPYLIHYSRAVEEEGDLERSLGTNAPLDTVTVNILKAVSRGVCLERVACHLGKRAREYPITKEVVRAIDASGEPERLLTIFRAAATEDHASCDVYHCDKKRTLKKKYNPPPKS